MNTEFTVLHPQGGTVDRGRWIVEDLRGRTTVLLMAKKHLRNASGNFLSRDIAEDVIDTKGLRIGIIRVMKPAK